MSNAPPDDVIDLSFDRVLGPIQAKKSMPDDVVEHLVGEVVQFFVPWDALIRSRPSANAALVGTNVYSTASSFALIALHQGVIVFSNSDRDDPPTYHRCVNVFNDIFMLLRQVRYPVKPGHNVVGVELVVRITPKIPRFENSLQFDIKSKSSRVEAYGVAVLFGQPVVQEYETFKLRDLLAIDLHADMEPEAQQWMRFSLTGEAIKSYCPHDFHDDGLRLVDWFVMKLHISCLYLETESERFELSLVAKGYEFKFARILEPIGCIAWYSQTPAKEALKELLHEHVLLSEIVWDEQGVTIKEQRYGPIFGYFWGRRKKRVGER
jgi:hypothetical protein